jgi:hypothetical protein
MMRALSLLILALASGTAAAEPSVQKAVPIEEKNVVNGKVRLDPTKGYIFLQGPERQIGIFIRVADDEDKAEYQKEWEKQFARERKRYPDRLERWRMDLVVARETKAKPPKMPVEPVRETFSIGPIEQRTQESFGPSYVYSKDPANKLYTYLTMVKPGIYIWYGAISFIPDTGYSGACACMGSVKFEVKPGMVTDLGNFLLAAPRLDQQQSAETNDLRANPEQFAKYEATRDRQMSEPRYGLPASLSSWPSARAEFSASGKIDNFLGVMVSRLPPIPGVLAYQRDTVVDARTNLPVTSKAMSSWRSR